MLEVIKMINNQNKNQNEAGIELNNQQPNHKFISNVGKPVVVEMENGHKLKTYFLGYTEHPIKGMKVVVEDDGDIIPLKDIRVTHLMQQTNLRDQSLSYSLK